MNGWRLAVVILAAFGVGYLLRFGVCVYVCAERSIRLYRRLLVAEANQDHAICQARLAERDRFIAIQDRRLNDYEAGRDTGVEAEEYLRERGS